MILQLHDLWWAHPYGGKLPICKRCGRALYIEQFAMENCPGTRAAARVSDIHYGEQDA